MFKFTFHQHQVRENGGHEKHHTWNNTKSFRSISKNIIIIIVIITLQSQKKEERNKHFNVTSRCAFFAQIPAKNTSFVSVFGKNRDQIGCQQVGNNGQRKSIQNMAMLRLTVERKEQYRGKEEDSQHRLQKHKTNKHEFIELYTSNNIILLYVKPYIACLTYVRRKYTDVYHLEL